MLLLHWYLLWPIIFQFGDAIPTRQKPLIPTDQRREVDATEREALAARPLKGRFLQISDLHPDPFYKYHSSSTKEDACHRGEGPAGVFGAETTDCDSPILLINATFKWIDENLKDQIDFVIWTGDSARHDNDEEIPRSVEQVTDLNRMMVHKFVEVFGKKDKSIGTDPTKDLVIPIVPSWGNNDILPHNIFAKAPNMWTKIYLEVWRKFIPEEQRHAFQNGGWFSVEVIPNKLVVFSLNTLYFFDSNSAVDGCADESEPGYQQMEWLRIQLQFVRKRGMKAILMGHVPPARTESKMSWDETCWQKYALWVHQFRDVMVGSVYGHMNIDHFMLQDSNDLDIIIPQREDNNARVALDDELTVESTAEYLTELRTDWSRLPRPSAKEVQMAQKERDSHDKKYFKKIGGPWGERYSLSLVSPSVVPNYFPTLRVFEYNITGIDAGSFASVITEEDGNVKKHIQYDLLTQNIPLEDFEEKEDIAKDHASKSLSKRFKIPRGPSKSTPPGPAYSPQTLSWLGYTQYFANLTVINDDFTNETIMSGRYIVEMDGWKDGKHHGKRPNNKTKPDPKQFRFEVEYDTRKDALFGLVDLTVKSYLSLAERIGQYKPKGEDCMHSSGCKDATRLVPGAEEDLYPVRKKHKKHRKKKKHGKHDKGQKRKAINRVWFGFVRRAFVGSQDDSDLHDAFGQPMEEEEGWIFVGE